MALTKAQLEALKNALLASGQPIIASTHRELIQNVINEMYDAQSRGNLLAGVQQNGTTTTGDTLLLIRSGEIFLVPTSLFGSVGFSDGRYLRITDNIDQDANGIKTFRGRVNQVAARFSQSNSGLDVIHILGASDVAVGTFKGDGSYTAANGVLTVKAIVTNGTSSFRNDNSGLSPISVRNAQDNTTFWGVAGNGRITQGIRSGAANEQTRRDEQRLFYLVTINITGAINNQALTAGIFNYRFTFASSITGFTLGEIGLSIIIQNQTGATLTLVHESSSSIAANRIRLIGAANLVIPIDGKATLIYCTGNRWELLETNFNGLLTNGFKARGVRTQTGFFDTNISGTTPVSIFETPFSWIPSYFSVGTVIEIDLSGTFVAVNGDLLFNLIIGESVYFDLAVLPGPNTNTFRLQYKITISESNEIKIVSTATISNGFTTSQIQSVTKNMNANFDIYIQARFVNLPANSNFQNNLKSNLIEVKVY